jgi:flavin-dependent dehydrogenase
VGAGSAGSSAAISAARLGARTLLLDRLPFLGGTSTAVLDTFYAFYTPGEKARRVVGGIGWEVAERLKAEGMAFERPNTYGAGTGVTYDPEVLKVVWERLAEDAQVDVLLHTWATGVELRDRRIVSIRAWNKGGESVFEAERSSTRRATPTSARWRASHMKMRSRLPTSNPCPRSSASPTSTSKKLRPCPRPSCGR